VSFVPSPTQSQIQTVLGNFFQSILPSGVEIVQGQDNRVPEPSGSDYVVMTPLFRDRFATNEDTYADCAFTGSISGTVLTVTAVQYGVIAVGSPVYGANVAANTTVTALGTGTGGIGTYTVSPSQTVASEAMAAGIGLYLQKTRVTFQVDVHGPNSADNVQTISTLFRDDYAYQFFVAQGFDVVPLYGDDPKQIPFINGEQQYENRWTLDVVMEANATVTAPQQFADQLAVTVTEVEADYPA
jgi:hypothetical protein